MSISDVDVLLLMVGEQDRGRLLKAGPSSSSSPAMASLKDGLWTRGLLAKAENVALTLWWDRLDPDGWDRMRRRLHEASDESTRRPMWFTFDPGLRDLLVAADDAVKKELGTRIVCLNRIGGKLTEIQVEVDGSHLETIRIDPYDGEVMPVLRCVCGGQSA